MNSALKNVAVTAFATQTLEGETWEGMCRYVVKEVENGGTFVSIKNQMHEVEKQMKADYDVSAMPSAWRSAKSVVLAAITEAVDLMSGTTVFGKTYVETRIKMSRLTRRTTSHPHIAYLQAAKKLERAWAALTQEQKDTVPIQYKWM